MLTERTINPGIILPDDFVHESAPSSGQPVVLPERGEDEWAGIEHKTAVLPDRGEDEWAEARGKKVVLPAHVHDSELMHSVFETKRGRKYFRIAWCIALYAVLILIWLPGVEMERKIYMATDEIAPTKRKVLRPPPEMPLKQVKMQQKRKVKVPMPDLTPDAPEPVIETQPEAQTAYFETDDWEIGVPDAPPPPQDTIARVGQIGVEAPIITRRVLPKYPEKAVKVRLTGYVILEAVLGKDGSVRDIKVLRGLGRGKFGFEEAAMDALKQWEFLPGSVNGNAADVRMTLKIDFMLMVGAGTG